MTMSTEHRSTPAGIEDQTIQCVVVIPALNEERRIQEVVRECRKYVSEVWVIDDGSRDSTKVKAESEGARVIQHESNLGKGMAIRTALETFLKSKYEFLIFMDADGQHDPSFIPQFLQSARQTNAEIILGNRMLSTEDMPFVRRWTNRLMSELISWAIHQPVPDTQCGYRLLTRRFVAEFRPTTYRFDLESEMLLQASRNEFFIRSLPISTIYRDGVSRIDPIADTIKFGKLFFRHVLGL
jgi:glycosyltransferase involved in cell wall biosynthesis